MGIVYFLYQPSSTEYLQDAAFEISIPKECFYCTGLQHLAIRFEIRNTVNYLWEIYVPVFRYVFR